MKYVCIKKYRALAKCLLSVASDTTLGAEAAVGRCSPEIAAALRGEMAIGLLLA